MPYQFFNGGLRDCNLRSLFLSSSLAAVEMLFSFVGGSSTISRHTCRQRIGLLPLTLVAIWAATASSSAANLAANFTGGKSLWAFWAIPAQYYFEGAGSAYCANLVTFFCQGTHFNILVGEQIARSSTNAVYSAAITRPPLLSRSSSSDSQFQSLRTIIHARTVTILTMKTSGLIAYAPLDSSSTPPTHPWSQCATNTMSTTIDN